MGALGWSPDIFWGATPSDLMSAYAGFRKVHGLDKQAPNMTPDELVRAYEEEIERGGRG